MTHRKFITLNPSPKFFCTFVTHVTIASNASKHSTFSCGDACLINFFAYTALFFLSIQ